MIPAGLAPLNVVFIGFQTSILCFPRNIFSKFYSKQDTSQSFFFFFFFYGKTLKFNVTNAYAD